MWFQDLNLVRQLPLHHRLFAHYCRWQWDESRRRVKGGSFLHRWLNRIGHGLGLQAIDRITMPDWTAFVDFADLRLFMVFDELLRRQPEQQAMAELLSAGGTLIDVGANHGSFSVLASKIVGSQGRVIAIEPNPRLAKLVQSTLDANGFAPAVVHQVACGAEAGEINLHIPVGGSSGTASVMERYNQGPVKKTRVAVCRLDDLLKDETLTRPVVIKLDIEGAEMDFLQGAQQTIQKHQPAILFELNPVAADVAGQTPDELVRRFESLGYEWCSSIDDRTRRFRLSTVDTSLHQNLIAHHSGN